MIGSPCIAASGDSTPQATTHRMSQAHALVPHRRPWFGAQEDHLSVIIDLPRSFANAWNVLYKMNSNFFRPVTH
jgi:hypothetical protein